MCSTLDRGFRLMLLCWKKGLEGEIFSALSLCSLCLCGLFNLHQANHRGTENAEEAQRETYNCPTVNGLPFVSSDTSRQSLWPGNHRTDICLHRFAGYSFRRVHQR